MWPIIPAIYTMAKTIMGGMQLSAFVISSVNDKEHLAATLPTMLAWRNNVHQAVNLVTAIDPIQSGAMRLFMDANDDAIRVYQALAEL